jgi:hypothetical protein
MEGEWPESSIKEIDMVNGMDMGRRFDLSSEDKAAGGHDPDQP